MKKVFAVIVLTVLLFSNFNNTKACTIFNVKSGDKILVGNNEDFWYSTDAEVWFVPDSKKSYGRVLFGWKNFAQGGMNTKGLFFDAADVSDQLAEMPKKKSAKKSDKPNFKGNIGEEVLEKCATVEEAVKLIESYNFPQLINGHLMFADNNGDSFVAEWIDGEPQIIRKEGSYQIITNYLLAKSKPEGVTVLRQDKVEEMLTGKRDMTGGYIASILHAVAQYGEVDGRVGGTLYSNVYELGKRELVVFYKRDFSKPYYINLEKELAKGKHTAKLENLFK